MSRIHPIIAALNAALERKHPGLTAVFSPAEDESVDDGVEIVNALTGEKSVVSLQIGPYYAGCNVLIFEEDELATGIVSKKLFGMEEAYFRSPSKIVALVADTLEALDKNAGKFEPKGGQGVVLHPLSPKIVDVLAGCCRNGLYSLAANSADPLHHDEDTFTFEGEGGEAADLKVVTRPGGCTVIRPSDGAVLASCEGSDNFAGLAAVVEAALDSSSSPAP